YSSTLSSGAATLDRDGNLLITGCAFDNGSPIAINSGFTSALVANGCFLYKFDGQGELIWKTSFPYLSPDTGGRLAPYDQLVTYANTAIYVWRSLTPVLSRGPQGRVLTKRRGSAWGELWTRTHTGSFATPRGAFPPIASRPRSLAVGGDGHIAL